MMIRIAFTIFDDCTEDSWASIDGSREGAYNSKLREASFLLNLRQIVRVRSIPVICCFYPCRCSGAVAGP